MAKAETAGKNQTGALRTSADVPGHFSLSSRRFAGVSKYGGKTLVNVREYYEKDGSLRPGSKGISLTVNQYDRLRKTVDEIDAARGKEPFEESRFKLSENRFVTVREYNSKILVDVREYYAADGGEMKPGKKGISLGADQWERLKTAMPGLARSLSLDGHAGEREEGTRGDATVAGGPVAPVAPVAPVPSQRGRASDAQARGADRRDNARCRLGTSMKFVTLENWRGQDVLDIREYYGQEGDLKPGKKGISLSTGQVKTLLAGLSSISDALSRGDASYALALSSKRRVTVSIFNQVPMVSIREFYEKEGKLLPTKKGISLTSEQWAPCRDAVTNLSKVMTF
jgi:hypothetical protein